MARNVFSPLADSRSSFLADWLEVAALILGRRHLSPAKARELLASVGGDADATDVAMAFGELHRRCERSLAYYPFGFSRLGIERRPGTAHHAYGLLSLASAASTDFLELADPSALSIALERFVADAVVGLLGPKARAVRFGYPPEPERPASFREAHAWLGTTLGVRLLPLMGADLLRADGGIDVVGWRPHPDPLTPGPIAVVQVTWDRDLRGKSLEIAGSDFNRWYRLAPAIPVLATPADGQADPDLMVEISGRALVLDRWRLLQCFEESRRTLAHATGALVDSVLGELEI